MGNVQNILLDPMNVTWGSDVAQVQEITCRADVSSDLQNDYFYLLTPAGLKYHVWYNVGGAGVDPAPGGSTAAVVAISANATASAVAAATEAVIEALPDFNSTVSGAVITVTSITNGYAVPAHEGVGSGFAFEVMVEGDIAEDVGFIDGNIEIVPNNDLVDVTAHQTGTNVLLQFLTGKNVEFSLTFKETATSQLQKLYRQNNTMYSSPGANGAIVVGIGTDKNCENMFKYYKKMVMHPVCLGASDKSRDITFWKTGITIESDTISGEEVRMVTAAVKAYPDTSKRAVVQIAVIGDSSGSFI